MKQTFIFVLLSLVGVYTHK